MGILDGAVAEGVGAAKYLPGLGTGVAAIGLGLDVYDALSEGKCL